ncbi:hypothetical protein [Sphingomonas sp. 3-13AW]|uniref:hypothetical protein n=1 Tax=Sphingomonas sp. 3-13AW TaxID=3050450 RepID=UPI003BB5BACC
MSADQVRILGRTMATELTSDEVNSVAGSLLSYTGNGGGGSNPSWTYMGMSGNAKMYDEDDCNVDESFP